MATNIYRGYSSFEFDRIKNFRLSDIEIVKMDLLNHIWTKKGERVMHSNFGTTIPELIFDPLDDFLLNTIQNELLEVINYDPRVELINMSVTPDYENNLVNAAIDLFYVEFMVTDVFDLHIELREQSS